MSDIVVETGSGLSTANSYASIADADDYHLLRNNTEWGDLEDEVKKAALIYATAYIDATFSWPGMLLTQTQALSWPRLSAFDLDARLLLGVPSKVLQATCELALVHAVEEAINITFDRGGQVESEQVSSVRITYFKSASAGKTFPFLTKMLSLVSLTGGVSSTRIVRS